MKLSDELRAEIINSMQARRLRPIDLAAATGLQQSTIGRILSDQPSISDSTADKLSVALGIALPQMLVLSAGGKLKQPPLAVFETAHAYGEPDIWADLAMWLRAKDPCAKAKAAVLSTAELGGFASKRLQPMLDQLNKKPKRGT